MRVAALSLAGIPVEQLQNYSTALAQLFDELQVRLAVLPAHTSFVLCLAGGQLGEARGFADSFRLIVQKSREWNRQYLELHSSLARECELFLVAGTTVEEDDGRYYHTSYCFGPDGEICGKQRQTHLSREERSLGLSRGEELQLFDIDGMKAGLVVGTDAFHPEVGRILALEGADLVAHSGAIAISRGGSERPMETPGQSLGTSNQLVGTSAGSHTGQRQSAGPSAQPPGPPTLSKATLNHPTGVLTERAAIARQQAGIWAQVQQNQFWAVEAQLRANIYDRCFGAQCAVIGPCEVTSGSTGYLDREDADRSFAVAELADADLRRIRGNYPLLRLLHPEAYRGLLPELYR